ncbi:MAG: hypothetical protein AAGD22_07585 [Verrucomicrobiota bacterium]
MVRVLCLEDWDGYMEIRTTDHEQAEMPRRGALDFRPTRSVTKEFDPQSDTQVPLQTFLRRKPMVVISSEATTKIDRTRAHLDGILDTMYAMLQVIRSKVRW